MDNEQGRLDRAAPIIASTTTVGQTFISHRSRLTAIEVLLVVYGERGASNGALTFHLRSDPDSSVDLATETVRTVGLTHNQTYRFTFDPLPDSQSHRYYFFLEGSKDTRVTVWYSSLDAYGEGTLFIDGIPQAGDLQFKTFYDYSVGLILHDALRGLVRFGWLGLPLGGLVLLPGLLVLLALRPSGRWDPLTQVALSTGLSLAMLPLGLLFSSLLGLSLGQQEMQGVLGVSAALVVGRLWQLRGQPLMGWAKRSEWPALGVGGAILGLSLGLRFVQIRGLVVPAWVDGLHHTRITQLIVTQGGVPEDYGPGLAIGPFIYHYGFHALAAGVHWVTGLEVPQAVLVAGQVVNGLVGLGVYALTLKLTGRRWAGVLALGVVGTVSLMPAYYATWGRYTQLTGLAVLPAAGVLTLEWLAGKAREWRRLAVAGLAVGGLGLVHYRVAVFYMGLVMAVVAYETGRSLTDPHAVRALWGRVLLLAGLSLLLILPWLARLYTVLVPTGQLWSWLQGQPAFNAVPRGLIDVGYDRPLLRLAGLSTLIGLIWWRRLSVVMLLWVAVTVLAANPNLLGSHETWLISNSSLVISLFFPMAILVGVLTDAAAHGLLDRLQGRWRSVAGALLIALFMAGVLRGAWNMIDIVNPATVIATRDDMLAMAWIRDHSAPDARFLTNVRIWQGRIYMGSDGGYWIPLLTGRQTLVPPALYYAGSADYFHQVQDVLGVIGHAAGADDPALQRLIVEQGIDYVYLGARGGTFTPKEFVNHPQFELAYSNGAVWIFRCLLPHASAP